MDRIALIVENVTWSFDFALTESLGQACKESGRQLVVYETRYNPLRDLPEELVRRNMNGVVILTESIILADAHEEIRHFIERLTLPCVTVGLRFPGIPCVRANNHQGTTEVMEHLFERGARKIAHIAGPSTSREASERKVAYLNAMAAKNLTVEAGWLTEGIFSPVSGYTCTRSLMPLIREHALDAIFFTNDEAASGGLRLLEAEAIKVPDTIMVAGYGDTHTALMTNPLLTTVSNNPKAMADKALSLLDNTTEEDADAPHLIQPILRKSASTGNYSRQQERKALLSMHPLALRHHPEFMPMGTHPESYWSEVAEKLQDYQVPQFHVIMLPTGGQSSRQDNWQTVPEAKILFSHTDGQSHRRNIPFPAFQLVPDEDPFINAATLVYKPIREENNCYGYLLTSPTAIDVQYLDDISAHCIRWMNLNRFKESARVHGQQLSETMSRLIATNRTLNALRVQFDLHASESLSTPVRTPRDDAAYLIFLVDIDGLQHINEHFGFREGDQILSRVDAALTSCIRFSDRVLRQGSDLFMLLIHHTVPGMVDVIQERLLQQLDVLNSSNQRGYRIDFTWGFAQGSKTDSFDSIIHQATEMLNQKRMRRNMPIP